MFTSLRKPRVDLATLILRVGLAIVFIWHGALKLGQEEGAGWSNQLVETVQVAVAWCELLGGILLAVGFLTRLAALGIMVDMISAIYMVTGGQDLVQGNLTKQGNYDFHHVGAEYNFVLIMMAVAIILLGSGRASLDHLLVTFWERKKRHASTSARPPVANPPALTPG